MMSSSRTIAAAVAVLSACVAPVAAQTWSACNPMNVTTCPDNTALGMNYKYNFTNANNASTWNATAGNVIYGSQGGEFTINKRYDSPTIQSEFYIMFGIVEVHMKAATGQGVISSIVLESDDLDEVDWEFMGGNNTHAETNYFGKGNTTSFDRALYYPVETPTETFHNYTTHWTKDFIEWYIDTKLVRTLKYADALGGYNFPQTPMNVRLGIWAGGDPSLNNGTIEWAGGITDFTKGPYTMIVQSVNIQDFGTGKAYHWSDKSGSYESIKSVAGNSTVAEKLTATPPLTMSQKWNNLKPGVRIGVYSAAGAVAAALAGLITFCCIRQRKAGRREHAAYLAKLDQERLESEAFQLENKNPDALPSGATPNQYNSGAFEKSGAAGFGTGAPPMPTPPPTYAGAMNPQSPNLNGNRSMSNNGPGSPRGLQPGSYRDGGLKSPTPIGYADGGMRSPSPGVANFSQPRGFTPQGFDNPRQQSPAPREYYGPGPNQQFGGPQFGGSSGGNYFSKQPNQGGYQRGNF